MKSKQTTGKRQQKPTRGQEGMEMWQAVT